MVSGSAWQIRKPDQTPVFGGSFHIPNYGENLQPKQATEQKA